MAKLFYDLSVNFYSGAILFASLFNKKAKRFIDGRKDQWKKISRAAAENHKPVAWFHCASLGEFEQGRPVMEAFKENYQQYAIFLTFFSPSGYEIRKNYEGADFVFYLPLDNVSNAEKLIRMIKPSIAFFIKYEFWYYYLKELHSKKIPTILFSAIFRENQLFFRKHGRFYRQMLDFYNHIFVQNQKSAELLSAIGIKNVEVSGDTRFDRVKQICSKPKEVEIAKKFAEGQNVMVLGSTWMSDMEIVEPLLNDQKIALKYIIAPHNISNNEMNQIEKMLNRKSIRFSKAELNEIGEYDILIIDNIGMLSSLYQYGILAYIGGAFRKALHNTLEAATYGIPVLFGNDETNNKFQEAIDLAREGAAFPITDIEHLVETVKKLLNDAGDYQQAAQAASRYIERKTGATEMILQHIKTLL